jgi:hypothetical protein
VPIIDKNPRSAPGKAEMAAEARGKQIAGYKLAEQVRYTVPRSASRNVSMTLRQPGVEFKLGCLGSSAGHCGPHSSVKYNKATCTTWQSLAEENVSLKGARCARIASGD